MTNIITFPATVKPALPDPPDALAEACYEWLGGEDMFLMTAVLRVEDCVLYDNGQPAHLGNPDIMLGSYYLVAEGTALRCCGKIDLYFSPASCEEARQIMALLAPGNFVRVRGHYDIKIKGPKPWMTLFVDGAESITPLPAEFWPVMECRFSIDLDFTGDDE